VTTAALSYKGFRFPPESLSHCVWLKHRFPLSFRDVQELMPQTVRRRLVCVGIRFFTCKHFLGEKYAAPVWCPVASHCSVLLVILSLPTTRVQPRWRRLLPPKPLRASGVAEGRVPDVANRDGGQQVPRLVGVLAPD
jgi:hypothetical protein